MDIGSWRWIPSSRLLKRGSEQVELTRREADLLGYLADRPGRVVDTAELLQEVWRVPTGSVSRAVAHTVCRLRRKLGEDGAAIMSVYGKGYRLELSDADGLVGRGALMRRLQSALDSQPVLGLYGIVGVGKSAIARQLQSGFEQAWWVPAGAVDTEETLATALATHMGLPPARGLPTGFATTVASLATVLVLDGANRLSPRAWNALALWLEDHPSVRVIVTSRVQGAAGVAIRVPSLETQDGLRLLAGVAGREQGVGEVASKALVELVDGVPAALIALGRQLRSMPLDSVRVHLRAGLQALGTGPGSIHAGMVDEWRCLEPDQQRVVRAAASFAAPFTMAQLRREVGLSSEQVLWALQAMLKRGWVETLGPRYRLLRLVRLFVARGLRGPAA
ncbi:MAG: winged helix-turn-helix domain-containing protein [Myxococcales bacterium]|nr:winged helix-turn-helix domain-containing protein [Myxococcales bacterium]